MQKCVDTTEIQCYNIKNIIYIKKVGIKERRRNEVIDQRKIRAESLG